MTRTKIVCTIGPASDSPERIESLIEAAPRPDDGLHAKDRADVRVYALQEWLEAVRLASERLDS